MNGSTALTICKKTTLALILLGAVAFAEDKPKLEVSYQEPFYKIAGAIPAFGKYTDILLPGVTAHLFSGGVEADSASLDSLGGFAFSGLEAGVYDIAFMGNMYFPQKMCGIRVDSTLQKYPLPVLVNLSEKYPDSTWRPEKLLYLTFKSTLTEDEVIRHLDWDYDLEIVPFAHSQTLQPILKSNGEKFWQVVVRIPYDADPTELAYKLAMDPDVYSIGPDLRLPLPPTKPGKTKGQKK